MKTYVIKYGDQYCAFGSYSTVRLFDNPLRATLYSQMKLAENRSRCLTLLKDEKITRLQVVELTMKIISEETVSERKPFNW